MKELAKPQHCVLLRSGIELWIDSEKVPWLQEALEINKKPLLKIAGELINPFEILGVFSPQVMEERQRRKNGQWKCLRGKWHEKNHRCECPDEDAFEMVTGYVDTPEGRQEIRYKRLKTNHEQTN